MGRQTQIGGSFFYRLVFMSPPPLFLPPTPPTHIHHTPFRNHGTYAHSRDRPLVKNPPSLTCSRPAKRTPLVGMLLSVMPSLARWTRTLVYRVLEQPQSTGEGGDVIVSAAAAGRERGRGVGRDGGRGKRSYRKMRGGVLFWDEIVESFDLVIWSFIMRSLCTVSARRTVACAVHDSVC